MSTGNWFLDGLDAVYHAIEVVVFFAFGISILVAVGYGIAALSHRVKEKASRKKKEKEEVGRKLQELEERIQLVVAKINKLDGCLELNLEEVFDAMERDEDEFRHRFEMLERRMKRYEMVIDATTEFNQQRLKAAAKRRKRA